MSDQITTQPKTPEEKFYDDLINNHRFDRPDKRRKQFNKTIGRESVFIKKLSMKEKKEFDTTKNFLITKFRPDQLNEATKKIKEGAQVKCLFFNLAKKDDDDFLNILRSGTFEYEDGTKDTNYEVKTVSIPKKMNYSLTSNDIIQDNNQTNNSESVKSNSLMKLDEQEKDDDALTSLKPQGSSFGRDDDDDDDDEEEDDDDDDISKKIEVVGMPNINSSPPSKPNKEIEENRRYKRKIPKIEYPKSDDEFNDDDHDDDDNNNSVVQYDKEADRIDGDTEKALSVISRRINDKPKQNITNTSVSVFAPGFNSRPKDVIPKLPILSSEIINSRDEIIERLDTLERRNYKEISKLKKQYKTFNTLLGNSNGMIDLAKSTISQQQQHSLQVITKGQESIKGLYQDVMTGTMQQIASSFNTVNQKEDALALGIQNLQQSQQDSQQVYQQALLGYSNSTNSSLQTLGSEVAKINTNIRELSQKPTPAIQNNVIVPKEATNYITSTVHKQIESSLGPFGEDIKLLKQGLKILDETTKKLIEYKPPQQYSPAGIVEESPDEIISGVNIKLDELLRKLLVRMANYKRNIIKQIQQQNQDLQGQLVPLQTSIQSTEERVLKSIKDNIDSSIVLINTNHKDLFNQFMSGLDEKYAKSLSTALQPVLDQGKIENEKLGELSKLQNDNLLLSKSTNESMTKLIEDSQKVPAKMIEGVKDLQEKATGAITTHVSTENGKLYKVGEETKSAVLDQTKKIEEIKTELGQIVQFQTNKTYNTEILEAIKKLSSDINEQIALAIKQGNKELTDTLKAYDETLRKIFEEQAKFNDEIKLLNEREERKLKDKEERRKQKDEQRKQDKAEYQQKFSELRDDINDDIRKFLSEKDTKKDYNGFTYIDEDGNPVEIKDEDLHSKGYINHVLKKEKQGKQDLPDIIFHCTSKDGTDIITALNDPFKNGLYYDDNGRPWNDGKPWDSSSNNSKSPDSLLKMIVKVAKKNNGNIELDDIGEIQDLDGEITDLYSQLLSIKSDIKEAEKKGDTTESDKLKVKYNKKREELNKCISRYSKELYKLSETKKKTKATFATHKYLMNKLNKL